MRRPGYREAIDWLAHNDDCYWLGDEERTQSVTASLVQDLFDVDGKRLEDDLLRALKRVHPNHEALRKRLPTAGS